MRRFILASTLLVAGCATAPTKQPEPQQPVAVAPVRPQQTQIMGMSASDLFAHFGQPALQIREGTSLKLQFRGQYCVLDAYLYPSNNGALRVSHVDARLLTGASMDQATCISSLE